MPPNLTPALLTLLLRRHNDASSTQGKRLGQTSHTPVLDAGDIPRRIFARTEQYKLRLDHHQHHGKKTSSSPRRLRSQCPFSLALTDLTIVQPDRPSPQHNKASKVTYLLTQGVPRSRKTDASRIGNGDWSMAGQGRKNDSGHPIPASSRRRVTR